MTTSLDPVTYALMEVRDQIPPEVLSIVFNNKVRGLIRMHVSNADACLYEVRNRVIEQRIRRVVDAAGAQMLDIPLEGLVSEPVDRYTNIWRIPKARTQGKSITSAFALTYGSNGSIGLAPNAVSANFNIAGCGNSQIIDNANKIMNAQANLVVNQSANCTIIGENVVMVNDYQPLMLFGYLRVIVGSDSEFSHIKPQAAHAFAQLVVWATKAYIWNNYRIDLGQGYLSGGQELPQVREVVESYSDAEMTFQDEIKRWRKIAKMIDGPRWNRTIRATMGSAR